MAQIPDVIVNVSADTSQFDAQIETAIGKILDTFPHHHVLGYGEPPPPFMAGARCPVCGTRGMHRVIQLSASETGRILRENQI